MPDMTLAEALALADQDSPLPHLAGQALKVLRSHVAASRWRPLSTAPTDGTYIIGLDPDFIGDADVSACQIVRFDDGAWRYAGGEYTHCAQFWCALPTLALPRVCAS